MIIARHSTARTIIVGPILDADGVAVTDAAVGDLKISKNGAAPAALNGSATLTHRNTGHYSLALTATDTNTVGSVEVVIDDTTNAMPPKTITVIEEAVYDAMFAASAAGYNATTPLNAAGVRAAVGLASADLDTQIGALPTAAENRSEMDSNSTQLAAIVADTSELQTNQGDWATATGFSTLDTGDIDARLAAYNVVATTDLPSNFADLAIAATNGRVEADTTHLGGQQINGAGSVDGGGLLVVGSVAGGINTAAGTITTLDGLDTAQDTQHGTTRTAIAAAQTDLDTITDTGVVATNMRGTDGANTAAPDNASIAAILEDTGTTLPAAIAAIQGAGFDTATDSLEAIRNNQAAGSTDWTSDEREQIRYRLQLDGDQTEPTDTDLPEVNVKQVNGAAVSLSGITFTINNSVASDGAIVVRRGTDYSPTIGTQLEVIKSGYASGAFASDATGAFRYRQADGSLVTAGTVTVTQSADTVTATITLTDTEIDAMTANKAGTWECDITSSGGLIADHGKGKLIVTDKVA